MHATAANLFVTCNKTDQLPIADQLHCTAAVTVCNCSCWHILLWHCHSYQNKDILTPLTTMHVRQMW